MKTSFLGRLIPRSVRLSLLKSRIIRYHDESGMLANDPERATVINYLRHHPLTVFPYSFEQEYDASKVEVRTDESLGLHYMLWEGKKLYYKDSASIRRTQRYFNSLLLEQDLRSPHRYLTPDFDVKPGSILADVGAAEGNFTLSVIDKISHAFIFEPDPEWVRALESTFAPYKDKVTIVPTLVGAREGEGFITLDGFFSRQAGINFLKADVEGFEGDLLHGGRELISRSKGLQLALCTYHRQHDAEQLEGQLKDLGVTCHYSDGFMIYHYGRQNVICPPYLRKAVIRGFRN